MIEDPKKMSDVDAGAIESVVLEGAGLTKEFVGP
jgi:hypothetical protein